MNFTLTHIHFENHVARRNVLVVELEPDFRIDLRKNLVPEVVVENEGELAILIRYLAAFVVKKVLLNVLADFLLFVLNV